jgi:hypothetical protein
MQPVLSAGSEQPLQAMRCDLSKGLRTMIRGSSSLTDPELHPTLNEKHLTSLKARGVSKDTALAAGLSSLTKHQAAQLLSINTASAGLGISYWGEPELSWRVRFDEADHDSRWCSPKGTPVRPYLPKIVPEEVWSDINQTLYIVEGPVKALALCEHRLWAVGLGGVETGHDVTLWREKQARLHPELLTRVHWKGRTVVIIFDAGRCNNPRVAFGEARLGVSTADPSSAAAVGWCPRTAPAL